MSKEKVVIDLMTDADNDAILELSHKCPQDGIIEGYPDRSPKFNRVHKQLSDKSYHMVGRQGGELLGAFGAVYTNLTYEDTDFETAYLLDLKVHPDHRRSRMAFRIITETVRYLREENKTKMAIATFLKNNEYSLIFSRGRAGIPKAEYLGDFKIFSIVPIMKKAISREFAIGHPTEEDIPELVDLYNTFYSKYKLAPRMSEDLLRFYTSEIDGMDLNQFWVARKAGKIKAVICAWDEDHYKRWFTNRMSRMMKFLSFLLKVLGWVFKMPAPLKEGQPIRHISLVMSAHNDSVDGMKALLRTVNNFHRGKEYTILQTHFHADDPINEALKGLTGFTVNAEAHVFTEDTNLAPKIAQEEGLVHFEWPMFI